MDLPKHLKLKILEFSATVQDYCNISQAFGIPRDNKHMESCCLAVIESNIVPINMFGFTDWGENELRTYDWSQSEKRAKHLPTMMTYIKIEIENDPSDDIFVCTKKWKDYGINGTYFRRERVFLKRPNFF